MLNIAYAQSYSQAELAAFSLVDSINNAIIFPLIALMMAVAFLIFLWGGFEFIKNANNETGRATGKQHMLWGVVGMLVMISAYAILGIAAGTFGLRGTLDNSNSGNISPLAPPTSPRPPTPGVLPADPGVTTPPDPGVSTPPDPGVSTPPDRGI